jgi:hypothetical protein
LLLSIVLIGLALLLTERANSSPPLQNAADDASILAAYNAAIYDSAVYKSSNVRTLKPLTFDPVTKKVTVVTLTDYKYDVGLTTLPVYVWVTQVPEVQQICQGFSGNLELSLRQLLGLLPNSKLNNFVVMTVTDGNIFRPAANPDPKTPRPCSAPEPPNCGEQFPKFISDAYTSWFANKALSAWVISEPSQPPVGYPWTRLGYTYNWKPGADKYGASEYVIEPGSSVTVVDIIPYDKYCTPKK